MIYFFLVSGAHSNSIEKANNLATRVLADGLLVVHDAQRRRQHHEAGRKREKKK
jgi:hypothetical protein